MFNDFDIVLDSPPRGFYTFEDNVSGKVVFESSHQEKIGWVYVFFHGLVNVEISTLSQPRGSHDVAAGKTKDKEILFQSQLKVYEGYDKLRKKTRYEWPFKFSFQSESSESYNLPSSGQYSFAIDRNWRSSVQYKIMAVRGEIGQKDDDIRWMFNPQYLREPPIKPTGIISKIKEKLGGTAEQELRFVQIRVSPAIDPWIPPPYRWDLNVETMYLPQLAPPPASDNLQVRRTILPLSVDLQIPLNIIIGEQFTVLLSVSSPSSIWIQNPLTVKLTSFKMTCNIIDTITIGGQREDETLKLRTVWERERLNIPLSAQPIDIGKIYSVNIAGEGMIQSFDTQLLHRAYNFPVELTVEVGGKSFDARYSIDGVNILSQMVASVGRIVQTQAQDDFKADFKLNSRSQPEASLGKALLQGTYLGRLTHVGAGLDRPLAEHSMMEAAIAVSRTLTEAGIQHTFPGGTLVKLFLDVPPSLIDNNKQTRSFGRYVDDFRRLFEKSFRVIETNEPIPRSLHLEITEPKHGENISVEFPDLIYSTDHTPGRFAESKKVDTYAMNITPVALFNYRLWCLATHSSHSGEPEICDIEPLLEAFKHDLRLHRRGINLKFAKVALRRHPMLVDVLLKIGIDMAKEKGKEVEPGVAVDEGGEEQLPAYDPGWGREYERDLVVEMEEAHFMGKEPAPSYEAGSSR